jgi:ribosomal protein L35
VEEVRKGKETNDAQVDQPGRGEAFSQDSEGFKRGQANRRHILTKMTKKRKRQLRGSTMSTRPTLAVLCACFRTSDPRKLE